MNWGEKTEAGKQYNHVSSSGFSPTKVELKTDGVLKHLGAGTWNCPAELTRHLDRIVLRAGSMESKWLVIRGSLYEKIAYFAKFMTWLLLWYLELDKVVSKALCRISKNMSSFPEELLYMHKDNGGHGVL